MGWLLLLLALVFPACVCVFAMNTTVTKGREELVRTKRMYQDTRMARFLRGVPK